MIWAKLIILLIGLLISCATPAARRPNEAIFSDCSTSLHAELASNYFALRALDAEIALLQRSIKLRKEALFLVQTRFANGVTVR